MAGLWERVKSSGLDGQGGRRINISLLIAGVRGYAVGLWSRVEIRDAINQELATNSPGDALTAAEETDLTAIANQVDAQPNETKKLSYVVGRIEAATIAGELGHLGEARWRSDLGI